MFRLPRSRPALLAGLFGAAAMAVIPAFAQHNLSFENIAEDAVSEPDGWSIAADGYAVDLDSGGTGTDLALVLDGSMISVLINTYNKT